jgi:hypothetical protein
MMVGIAGAAFANAATTANMLMEGRIAGASSAATTLSMMKMMIAGIGAYSGRKP